MAMIEGTDGNNPAPAATQEHPIGLLKLATLSKVSVARKDRLLHASKFVVTTETGEVLFNVKENTAALAIYIVGEYRKFNIDLYDTNQQKVVNIRRRSHTCGLSKLKVSVLGELVSVVLQQRACITPVLHINDAQDQPVLRAKMYSNHGDFKLLKMDQTRIGFIEKKRSGCLRELCSNSTNYEIEFTTDLDVNYKVAVIGTCLLINFLSSDLNSTAQSPPQLSVEF